MPDMPGVVAPVVKFTTGIEACIDQRSKSPVRVDPFRVVDHVHEATFDVQLVWYVSGGKLNALDPASGKTVRTSEVAGHARTGL